MQTLYVSPSLAGLNAEIPIKRAHKDCTISLGCTVSGSINLRHVKSGKVMALHNTAAYQILPLTQFSMSGLFTPELTDFVIELNDIASGGIVCISNGEFDCTQECFNRNNMVPTVSPAFTTPPSLWSNGTPTAPLDPSGLFNPDVGNLRFGAPFNHILTRFPPATSIGDRFVAGGDYGYFNTTGAPVFNTKGPTTLDFLIFIAITDLAIVALTNRNTILIQFQYGLPLRSPITLYYDHDLQRLTFDITTIDDVANGTSLSIPNANFESQMMYRVTYSTDKAATARLYGLSRPNFGDGLLAQVVSTNLNDPNKGFHFGPTDIYWPVVPAADFDLGQISSGRQYVSIGQEFTDKQIQLAYQRGF